MCYKAHVTSSSSLPPRPISGSASHVVRVAVVQIAYHWAIHGSLCDPKGQCSSDGILPKSTWPQKHFEAPTKLRAARKELSQRVREQYIKQFTRKICSILDTCRTWNVRLVVFPELSIPAASLEEIAAAAGDMTIVAGSSFIDASVDTKASPYRRLGWPNEPRLRQNTCPIIHANKIIGLTPKLHGITEELELDIDVATDWSPVDLPDDIGGPLGVLTCLDFLERTSHSYSTLVAPKINHCRAIAVPSLTSANSLPLFQGHQLEESGPGRRPTFYANHTPGGGTTIFAGNRSIENQESFPDQPGILIAGEEGIIVTDVDLAVIGVGKGGRYGETPRVRPFAAATLVYTGTTPNIAKWLQGLRNVLPEDAGGEKELEILELVKSWIVTNPPPLSLASPIQKRRWEHLLHILDDASGLEILRRLTRDVQLPAEILPLRDLQAALSEGASKAIHEWLSAGHDGAASLATVEETLHKSAHGIQASQKTWMDTTCQVWTKVVQAVHGQIPEPPRPSNSVMESLDRATETIENKIVRTAINDGNEQARLGDYERARENYERALIEAQNQGRQNTVHGVRWSLLEARARIGAASCAINLQDPASARALIENIDYIAIDNSRKIAVANLWAALEDQEQARALLALLSPANEEESHNIRIVEQRLAILDGHIPPHQEISSPDVAILAASRYLERGDLSPALALTMQILTLRREAGAMFSAEAVRILLACLVYVANEDPFSDLSNEHRRQAVELVEKVVPNLLKVPLPQIMRSLLVAQWREFLSITRDVDALEESADHEKSESSSPFREAIKEAERLATEGRLEAAFSALPSVDNPWQASLLRAEMLVLANQDEAALADLIPLADRYPGRPLLDLLVCDLLRRRGDYADALVYAKRGFEIMPARGSCIRIAECLLETGRHIEAWNKIVGYEASASARLLHALARCAELAQPSRALGLWNRYLHIRPRDIAASFHVSRLLLAKSDVAAAADLAWSTFERFRDVLTVDQIYQTGHLQMFVDPAEERKRRIQSLVAGLEIRFPSDPSAEHARFHLLQKSGLLREAIGAIDFGKLQSAGFIALPTEEEFLSSLRTAAKFTQTVFELGRRGGLPLSLFCASVQPPISVPVVLTRLFGRDDADVLFSTPLGLDDVPKDFSLKGASILISETELYLLEALGLLAGFKEHLEAGGQLSMFSEAHKRIVADRTSLRSLVQVAEHDRIARLILKISNTLRIVPKSDELELNDVQIVKKRGGLIVSDEGVSESVISPLSMLYWLRDTGRIASSVVEQITPHCAVRITSVGESDLSSSRLVLVELPYLELLIQYGAYNEFLAAFPLAHVDRREWRHLHIQQQIMSENSQALHLCENVHRWVAACIDEGFMRVVASSTPDKIPPLLDEENLGAQALIKGPVQWVARYADALAADNNLWRISADFLGTTAPIMPEMVPYFAWKSRGGDDTELRSLLRRFRAGTERHVSLPAIVRLVLGTGSFQQLFKLASLGFSDALGVTEMLMLSKQYGGLSGIVPARILDRLEWMAREPRHIGGETARLRLGRVYADSIFHAFCGPPRSLLADGDEAIKGPAAMETGAADFAQSILERSAALSRATRTDFLACVFYFIALRSTSATALVWDRNSDDTGMKTRTDGPLAALWGFLNGWATADHGSAAAFNRAISGAWLALCDQNEFQRKVTAATLPHVPNIPDGKSRFFTTLADEAESILSALWTWRPTTARGISIELSSPAGEGSSVMDETLLQFGAEPQTKFEVDRGGRFVAYEYLPAKEYTFQVVAPVEAVLLRQTPKDASRFARFIRDVLGVHDGRMYRLLSALATDPSRSILRHAVALRGAEALWRRVRDDPAYLVAWPRQAMPGRPSLRDLRGLLSEPRSQEEQQSMTALLFQRVNDTNGYWHARNDRWAMLSTALEVPGPLSTGLVASMVANDFETHLKEALSILETSSAQSTARIARSIVLLRIGAEQGLTLSRPQGGDIDLFLELPQLLDALVKQLTSPQTGVTIGGAEASLLRVCRAVVIELAHGSPLAVREGIWLTYRLYQWLVLQLNSLDSAEASAGITKLISAADPPGQPTDLLDPLGFGVGHFDQRMAGVLYALSIMEDFASFVRPGDSVRDVRVPKRVTWTSDMLERVLLLASTSTSDISRGITHPSGSVLDWDAQTTIQGLATVVLLKLDPLAFRRLPQAVRRRWLSALPAMPDKMTRAEQSIFMPLMIQFSLTAESLTSEERIVVLKYLSTIPEVGLSKRWRMMAFCSLFHCGDPEINETTVISTLLQNLDDPGFPLFFALYLRRIATMDRRQISASLSSMIAGAYEMHCTSSTLVDAIIRGSFIIAEPERSRMLSCVRSVLSGNRHTAKLRQKNCGKAGAGSRQALEALGAVIEPHGDQGLLTNAIGSRFLADDAEKLSFPPEIPRIYTEIFPSDIGHADSGIFERVGEHVDEVLECRPSTAVVIRVVRPKMRRASLVGSAADGSTIIYAAEPPDRPLGHCIAGPGMLADTIVCRWAERMPFYHQRKLGTSQRLSPVRTTIFRWHAQIAVALEPLLQAMLWDALSQPYLCVDTVGALRQFAANPSVGPLLLISPGLHVLDQVHNRYDRSTVRRLLSSYRGCLATSASICYEHLHPLGELAHFGCWAACRQYFIDALPSDPGRATRALHRIGRLYLIEDRISSVRRTIRERVRREKSNPVLGQFFDWCDTERRLVGSGSLISEAFLYAHDQRAALQKALDDGSIGLTAISIRRKTVCHENYHLLGHREVDTQVAATFSSLLTSCRLHGIEPRTYLRDLLILLQSWPKHRMLELAPAYWTRTLQQGDARGLLAASAIRAAQVDESALLF